ncbi:hypothetical protein V6N13_074754 [Hibiscus sabdariffa]
MPLRCETHFGMGVPVEDQNVSVGLVRNDVLPPPPPHIPHSYVGTSVGVSLCERCNRRHPGEYGWATV